MSLPAAVTGRTQRSILLARPWSATASALVTLASSRGVGLVKMPDTISLAEALELHPTIDTIVIDAAPGNEYTAFGDPGWVPRIETAVTQFLEDCRDAVRVFLRRSGGRIFVLAYDDGFARDVPYGASPVVTHARIGCLKCLAKEYGRSGLSFNAIVMQPPAEAAVPAVWAEARARIKVYGLKYKPMPATSYAAFILDLVTCEHLPANGSVFDLGSGVTEFAA